MRVPTMPALVLMLCALTLGGCPVSNSPSPYEVTEARYCLGTGAEYVRLLFVSVAEHPTECVVVNFAGNDATLGASGAETVSAPCADVFFDGTWIFGPVSSTLSATALARIEVEVFADRREVTYEVVLTLTDATGEHVTTIEGTATERTQSQCRTRPPVGP